MLKFLFRKNTIKKFSTTKNGFNINNFVLYNGNDYMVIEKEYGMSTFGRNEKKKSVIKNLHLLNNENTNNFEIVYKLHSSIGGCLLICKNKFIKKHFYKNIFITLVYGKIKEKCNTHNEIKMYLKYIPNSNIMIPDCENSKNFQMLTYEVISNTIMLNKQNFSLLKIYINANNSKYIKPLLFYSLNTCIVGDNEYINVQKKLKFNSNFFYDFAEKKNKNYNLEYENKMLLKNLHKYNKELKLHLCCFNVTFESHCNKLISIFCQLPKHIKDTLDLFGASSLIKFFDTQIKNKKNFINVINEAVENSTIIEKEEIVKNKILQINKNINIEENNKFYDSMKDQNRLNEEFLKEIYEKNDINKRGGRKKPRRGILAKKTSKLTIYDAPIHFTDI
ncbi:conserved Plasmodium protein, unknown function [Plasmodium berghei]|uniref:Pseudouridine synthase, putative n=2 Tax=Plasmodium berghei TaxID=5821 RepID=A0A509AFR8_PLABA|nr:pseudouridine synthase, putative [Plasmodium berghei ANKA]CXH94650.1 conserved Plasmodium protein, unknown function [Plasmodium berghei]SCL90940.1 conserved Plasmodium protein, unknown function [Plasmodium berghei]SCM15387.1 conserved Plasmodium protein, unknown function [Plasmodium berghei]SCM17181.1 conserved Plasmodium protein, unknown function [Plasmodium berghei]SCN22222.1 conserved Plasmodium protein, unknown function [Plasmodium berghei]|eukprot:XP_034419971.1 pseudouridine synthase, putative [Plasmodium berghei ANKA]